MFEAIKKVFGLGPQEDYAALVKAGAQIIDVRSREEYKSGHIEGSVNIPLQSLSDNLKKIKKDKPVITCCASGVRSASAKGLLKSKGYTEVYNGGGWYSLERKLNR